MNGPVPLYLILDQGFPRDAATLLRGRGSECKHVSEIGMSTVQDEDILEWSLLHEAVVVTLDADFPTILALSGARGPSVVRIRLQSLDAAAMAELIFKVIADFGDDLKTRVSRYREVEKDHLPHAADRRRLMNPP